MNESRRHVRHVVSPRLYVAMNGASSGGILHDVSDDGMSLDLVGPRLTEERVLLDFDMSETGEHFEGTGKVVWKREADDRVGLQFVDLPDASRNKVRNWLSAKTILRENFQNVVLQDRSDTATLAYATWLRERNAGVASAVLEPRLLDGLPSAAPAESVMPAAPPEPTNNPKTGTSAPKSDVEVDKSRPLANPADFRSEPEQQQILPESKPPFAWKELVHWILLAAIVFLSILAVGLGLRFAATKDFKIGARYKTAESFVAKLLSPLVSDKTEHRNGPSIAPHTNKEPKAVLPKSSKPGAEKPPLPDQFEVFNPQNGRQYVPRNGANDTLEVERPRPAPPSNNLSASTNSSAAAERSVPTDAHPSAGKVGQVSKKFSGEAPVVDSVPKYPTLALEANIQARVVLNAIIAANGTLRDVRLVSPPSMLDATVLEALKKWRYRPHYENGKPVEAKTQIVVEFSITLQ
jgi:TonB family protein